jgi:hypothetical protein
MKAYWIKRAGKWAGWYGGLVGCLVPAVELHGPNEMWGREPQYPHCASIIEPGDADAVDVPDDTPMWAPWEPPSAQDVVAPLLKALNDRIMNS